MSTKKTKDDLSSVEPGLILRHSDWNMADDRWTWGAYLRRRKDGRYTLSLVQAVENPPSFRVPGLVGFRKGGKLFEFLQGAWYEQTGIILDEAGWLEIIKRIEAIDSRLATEVLVAVKAEFDPAPPTAAKMKEWEVHATKATWEPLHFTTGLGGMRAMAEHAHREERAVSVKNYVLSYMKAHGELPMGVHRVPPDASGAETPRLTYSARTLESSHFEVKFPTLTSSQNATASTHGEAQKTPDPAAKIKAIWNTEYKSGSPTAEEELEDGMLRTARFKHQNEEFRRLREEARKKGK